MTFEIPWSVILYGVWLLLGFVGTMFVSLLLTGIITGVIEAITWKVFMVRDQAFLAFLIALCLSGGFYFIFGWHVPIELAAYGGFLATIILLCMSYG